MLTLFLAGIKWRFCPDLDRSDQENFKNIAILVGFGESVENLQDSFPQQLSLSLDLGKVREQ